MPAAGERVILVDADDRAVGAEEKLAAHVAGLRHRAISVVVRDGAGRLMLQRRSAGKYHSGGLWTNTCCSHPRPDEATADAAARRLVEEMGFSCPLAPLFVTHYRAPVGNGLIEDEIVHVFGGRWDGGAVPDPREVSDWRWAEPATVAADLAGDPAAYTVWFGLYLERFGTRLGL